MNNPDKSPDDAQGKKEDSLEGSEKSGVLITKYSNGGIAMHDFKNNCMTHVSPSGQLTIGSMFC